MSLKVNLHTKSEIATLRIRAWKVYHKYIKDKFFWVNDAYLQFNLEEFFISLAQIIQIALTTFHIKFGEAWEVGIVRSCFIKLSGHDIQCQVGLFNIIIK